MANNTTTTETTQTLDFYHMNSSSEWVKNVTGNDSADYNATLGVTVPTLNAGLYFYYWEYSEWVLLLVLPIITLSGMAGNVINILVLQRHGLNKSYNIALLGLAIGDLMFLTGASCVLNVPQLLYLYHEGFGFYYSQSISYALYIVHEVFLFLKYYGSFVTFTVPAVIVCERLIAVFCPHRFLVIVSSFRMKLAIAALYVMWFPFCIITSMSPGYIYVTDPVTNRSVGHILQPDWYSTTRTVCDAVTVLLMCGVTLVVVTGCVAIMIKWKRRVTRFSRRMSIKHGVSHKHSEKAPLARAEPRITRDLLVLCLVYAVLMSSLLAANYIAISFPSYINIIDNTADIICCINSGCNIIIYQILNPKFRVTLKEIIGRCCFCRRQ